MTSPDPASTTYSPPPAAGSAGLGLRGLPTLKPPYLIYFGDVQKIGFAKTGLGLIQWRRELCAGQFRAADSAIDGGLPDMSIEEAIAAGVQSLVIGVASPGGSIPDGWTADLSKAAQAGLDIVSGMHAGLSDIPDLARCARVSGARLVDIRVPPTGLRVASGRKRNGFRLLTVGMDCAVGKKYTALALEQDMRRRGWLVDFRATGQTGIMIAGQGIPIDAVVSDFLAGAAEALSPDAADGHWDVIEGQGAIAHPAYAGVCVGLLHGSQPDALVLCHDPSRETLLGFEDRPQYALEDMRQTMDSYLALARRVNPAARFVGVALNTSRLSNAAATLCRAEAARVTGLPVVDPIADGVGPIIENIELEFRS